MKSVTSRALVAVVATALSLGGLSAVYAQATAPAASSTTQPGTPGPMGPWGAHHRNLQDWGMHGGRMGPGMMMGGMMGGMASLGEGPRARLLNLVCSDRGAEAIDIAFVRLSYRLKPTADQQAAFDALKSTALEEQAKFADACKTAAPQAGQKTDPVQAMKDRITLETARLAAMNAILPKFEALYSSLDDAQKAALTPQRRFGQGPAGHPRMMGQWDGQWHGRMGGQWHGPRGPWSNDQDGQPPAATPQSAPSDDSTSGSTTL